MAEIGSTLREARMRAHIDLSEIEEQTKIRARYLRALENEEWGLLPGAAYTKSFLRAYAQALGLDGRALVEEYKTTYEDPGDGQRAEPARHSGSPAPRRDSAPPAPRRPRPGGGVPKLSRGYLLAVVSVCVVIVLALVGLLERSSPNSAATRTASHRSHVRRHRHPRPAAANATAASGAASTATVTLSLHATGRIWVCLVETGGHQLIPGSILLPGEEKQHTYRATRFEVNLGNNNVEMVIDGKHQEVPNGIEPIGYAITTAGVSTLAPGHLPTCA